MNYRELLSDIQDELNYVETLLKNLALCPEPALGEPSGHLLGAGGKRLRPAFVLLSGKFFNFRLDRAGAIAAAIELIHMASLVHDDVIDGATTRRGLPTVSARWGEAVALYTGDYLLARALGVTASLGNREITRVLSKVSLRMCEGEIEQIESAGRVDLGLRTYLKRINRKTAMLISACCLIGALCSDAPREQARCLQRFGYYLGMAFQITDDLLDFTGSEAVFGKPVGSDLRQGIITLPVYFALGKPGFGQRLAELLRKKVKEERDWLEAGELVCQSGALENTRQFSNWYLNRARRELTRLPDLPPRRTLAAITDFIGIREF